VTVALGAFVVLEFITPEPLVNFRLLGRRTVHQRHGQKQYNEQR
jgi:hypothetical protein